VTTRAVVVAAGSGTRFGGQKQFLLLNGSTVAAQSVALARSVADQVVLVVPAEYDGDGEGADLVVTGGDSRSASVRAGLAALDPCDIVVIHDAARPQASTELFHAVVAAVAGGADAAIPGVAISDTVKRVEGTRVVDTLNRDELVAVQTPQAFRADVLERAHASGDGATDDAALVERQGGHVVIVPGSYENIKITQRTDVLRLHQGGTMRIGHGYDVHRLGDDDTRPLMLGLVHVPGTPGLLGHSDADVATHALCDAILGAAGLGDLGRHFPDSDESIRGIASSELVTSVVGRVAELSLRVASADITIVAERPKLSPFMPAMSRALSAVVGAPVSVKATTTEGLDAIGRGEGIAATAVVLLEEIR